MDAYSVAAISLFILGFIAVPGFMLTLALFPRKNDLDNIERMGLSTVLGFTPIFLLYCLEKNMMRPRNATTSAAMFIGVSVLGYAVFKYRKRE